MFRLILFQYILIYSLKLLSNAPDRLYRNTPLKIYIINFLITDAYLYKYAVKVLQCTWFKKMDFEQKESGTYKQVEKTILEM